MSERLVHGVIPVVVVNRGKPVVLTADYVLQRERVAVPVGVQRVRERQLARGFPLLAEVHEQLVLDTFGGIGGQLDVFIRLEGVDCLDQPDGADRD